MNAMVFSSSIGRTCLALPGVGECGASPVASRAYCRAHIVLDTTYSDSARAWSEVEVPSRSPILECTLVVGGPLPGCTGGQVASRRDGLWSAYLYYNGATCNCLPGTQLDTPGARLPSRLLGHTSLDAARPNQSMKCLFD